MAEFGLVLIDMIFLCRSFLVDASSLGGCNVKLEDPKFFT